MLYGGFFALMHLYMAVMAKKNQVLRLQRQTGVLAHRNQVVYLQRLLDKVLAAKLTAAATQLVEKPFLPEKSIPSIAHLLVYRTSALHPNVRNVEIKTEQLETLEYLHTSSGFVCCDFIATI